MDEPEQPFSQSVELEMERIPKKPNGAPSYVIVTQLVMKQGFQLTSVLTGSCPLETIHWNSFDLDSFLFPESKWLAFPSLSMRESWRM